MGKYSSYIRSTDPVHGRNNILWREIARVSSVSVNQSTTTEKNGPAFPSFSSLAKLKARQRTRPRRNPFSSKSSHTQTKPPKKKKKKKKKKKIAEKVATPYKTKHQGTKEIIYFPRHPADVLNIFTMVAPL
jgi:hypothetical protein